MILQNILGLALAMTLPALGTAAAFTPGNLAVYRIGSGSGSLVNTGNPIFIDEYTPAGVLVQSIALPSATSGLVNACVASGTATSEGLLTRSSDGNYLLATGYKSDLPAAGSLSGTTGTAVPRVAARIDGAGAIDTSTALTDFASANNPRGAVSSNGTDIWVTGGAGGIRYATFGASTSTQLSTTVTNLRQPAIFGGQLYVSTSSGSAVRLGTVGVGTPTTIGQTISNLPGIPAATGSPYGYVLLDLDAGVAGVDTLYIADDGAAALTKYSLVGATWTSNGVIGIAADAYRGLTATVSGASVTLYATRKGGSVAAGGGELVKLVDASGYNGAFTGVPSLLATAAANTAFRGVALAPNAAVALPDLTAAVAGPATGVVGTPYDYTITFSNSGTQAAGAYTGSFTLPAGVSFVGSAAGGGCSGSHTLGVVSLSCTGLAAGASASPSVSVTPTAAGTVNVPVGAVVADSGNAVAESNEANNASASGVTTNISNGLAPVIQFDGAATSNFVEVPLDGPGAVSGVIGDTSDPASTLGIAFALSDGDSAMGGLSVSVSSSNLTVVPNANLVLTGSGASRLLKITPASVGYSTISITVSDPQNNSDVYVINYAASDGSGAPASTRWHTSGADASTAVAIDSNTLLAAIDEDQRLRFVDRDESGLPTAEFNANANLALSDLSGGLPREVDIEASVRVGSRVFFLGSHSNSASGNLRPNRYRLFAVDLSAPTTLSYVGRYDGLRDDLIAWDSSNAHGLGANHFGLAASAAAGVIPEDPSGGGFNIEGLAIAPNGQAYLAFRAPIVPASARTRALIVPLTNLAALVSANPSAGPAAFGAPIQLDLGGRGIRSLDCNASECLIIAGPASAGDFRLYTWDGNADSTPLERSASLAGLNPEGIVEIPAVLTAASSVQIVSDLGDSVFYGDGVIAKDLPQDNWKKFRSDWITLGEGASLSIDDVSVAEGNAGTTALNFTVSLSAPVTNTVSVQYASADGSATLAGGDYQNAVGTLVYTPGQTSKALTVLVNGDLTLEGAETLLINLSQAQGASIADAQGVGTLNNDDAASIAISDVTQTEGDNGSTQFVFNTTLSGSVQGGFSVAVVSADGSAAAGSDYTAIAAGQLNFAGSNGETQSITVSVSGDSIVETNESFTLDLGTPSNPQVAVSDGSALGTINNDDSASVAINSQTLAEGDGGSSSFVHTVTLTGSVQDGFDLPYQTADGSAQSGSDYTAASGTLSFSGASGQTRPIAIAVSGDSTPEADETYFIDLGSASVAAVSNSVARGTGTLVNDDLYADVSVSISNGVGSLLPGQSTLYSVSVRNTSAFVDLPAVQISQTLAPELIAISWTCSASGGAACPASGSGPIATTLALPKGGEVVYQLSATLAPAASAATVSAGVAAQVSAPYADPNPGNDSAADVDNVLGDPLFRDGFE